MHDRETKIIKYKIIFIHFFIVLCGLGYIVASTSSTASHPTSPSMGVDICERSVLESIKYGGI